MISPISSFAQSSLGISVGDKVQLNDITLKYEKTMLSRVAIFNDGRQVDPSNRLIAQSECVVSMVSVHTRVNNQLKNIEASITEIDSKGDFEVRLNLKITSVDGTTTDDVFGQIHCALGVSGLFENIKLENIIYNIGGSRISISR